jgi:hypothetical protein
VFARFITLTARGRLARGCAVIALTRVTNAAEILNDLNLS